MQKICVLYFVVSASTNILAQIFNDFTVPCSFRQRECFDGSCISTHRVCDGFEDYADVSDEALFMRPQSRCARNSFDCGDSCIDFRLVCDGENHCANGFDESDKICRRKLNCYPTPYIDNGWVRRVFSHAFSKIPSPTQDTPKFEIKCRDGYSLGSGNLTCINGTWTGTAPLCTKCGILTPGPRRMTPEGDSYQYGTAPWHVGVYNKLKNPYKLVCGGSLITAKFILSAAQCFWDDAIGLLPAPIFAVAVGKVYSGWEDDRDYYAQSSDVDEINVPELFIGETNNLMHNVAFVTVASSFEFTKFVKPVCIDFADLFVRQRVHRDFTADVWRLTNSSTNGSSQIADVFKVASCKSAEGFSYEFLKYVTEDKACAEYDGTAVGPEVAGSGLVFSRENFGEKLIHLQAIASVGKKQPSSALIFTNILDYQSFIQNYLGN